MANGWLVDWFVRYLVILVCRSVGQTIWPVFYLTSHWLTDHRRTGHLNIHPPALDQQPKTLLYKRTMLEFPLSGFNAPPFPSGRLAAVGLPDPCLQTILVKFEECFIQPIGGYIPPRLDGHFPNRMIWEHSLGVCGLVAMSFIRTYRPISCYIQLALLRRHLTRNGLRQIFGDIPWVRPTPTWSRSWIKCLVWGTARSRISLLVWF